MADNTKDLYDKLKQSDAVELPEYGEFQKKYGSDQGLKDLHKKLSANPDFELPSEDEFVKKYSDGQKKTSSSASSQPVKQEQKPSTQNGLSKEAQAIGDFYEKIRKQKFPQGDAVHDFNSKVPHKDTPEELEKKATYEAERIFNSPEMTKKSDEAMDVAVKTGKEVEENSRFPVIKQLTELHDAFGKAKSPEEKNKIYSQIEEIKKQPFIRTASPDVNGHWDNPADPFSGEYGHTNGQLWDKVQKGIEDHNSAYKTYESIAGPRDALIKATRDAQGFKLNKDGVHEYSGFAGGAEAFWHAFKQSADDMKVAYYKAADVIWPTKSDIYKKAANEQSAKNFVKNSVLYPTEAKGVIANTGEALGGMAIPAAAAMIPGLGELSVLADAGVFGLQGLGGGYQKGYINGKTSGLSDEDATRMGNKEGAIDLVTNSALGAYLGKSGKAFEKSQLARMDKTIAQTVKANIAHNGEELAAFSTEKALNNAAKGKPIEEDQGEALKGFAGIVGMKLGLHVAGKLPKAAMRLYDYGMAKTLPLWEPSVKKAVEDGKLTPTQGDQMLEQPKKDAASLDRMPTDWSPAEKEIALPHQRQIDDLQEQLKKSNAPAVQEELKSQIEKASNDMVDAVKKHRSDAANEIKEADTKIQEAQERLGLPTEPELHLTDEARATHDKLKKGEPATAGELKTLSDELYDRYHTLKNLKDESNRQFTTKQIDDAISNVGHDIDQLEKERVGQLEGNEAKPIELKTQGEDGDRKNVTEGTDGSKDKTGEATTGDKKGAKAEDTEVELRAKRDDIEARRKVEIETEENNPTLDDAAKKEVIANINAKHDAELKELDKKQGDDSTNRKGPVPGKVGDGKEPVITKSDKSTGAPKTSSGGVVQNTQTEDQEPHYERHLPEVDRVAKETDTKLSEQDRHDVAAIMEETGDSAEEAVKIWREGKSEVPENGSRVKTKTEPGQFKSRLKELREKPGEFGETFTPEGAIVELGDGKNGQSDDVVTLASENVKPEDLTEEKINEFVSKHKEFFDNTPDATVGVFKIEEGPHAGEWSIDANTIVGHEHHENTKAFAKGNNQVSIYSGELGEVKTGGNGETTLAETKDHIAAAKALARGEEYKFPSNAEKKAREFRERRETKRKAKEEADAKQLAEDQKSTRKFTKDNIDTLDTSKEAGVKKDVLEDAKNVVKAVAKLVRESTGNDLTLHIHDKESTFNKAVEDAGGDLEGGRARGMYVSADGAIHLNMEHVRPDTMLHEGFHPVLDHIAEANPEALDDLYSQLKKLDPTLADTEDVMAKKEALTDFMAKVANGDTKLDSPTAIDRVKDVINKALQIVGMDKIPASLGIDLSTASGLKDLAKMLSDKVAKGEEIEPAKKTPGEKTSPQFQMEKVFAGTDKAPVFKDVKQVAQWLQDYAKKNAVFQKSLSELSDKEFVKGLVDHTIKELKAWHKIKGDKYVSFYDHDINQRLNPELQRFANKRYGRDLTQGEVRLFHTISGFASAGTNPKVENAVGLKVFDRYMRTGELHGFQDEGVSTKWETKKDPETGKEIRVDTGEPNLDKDGDPKRRKVTIAFLQDQLEKTKRVIDHFGGDVDKAMDWLTTKHSYAELSKIMGTPEEGEGALKTHENLTQKDGGLGMFAASSEKVGSYILNKIGDRSTVTKDRWYARTMARLSGQPIVGKDGLLDTPWNPKTKEGLRARILADKAWAEVAKKTRDTPSGVQEKMWDFEKRMWEQMGAHETPYYASEGLKQAAHQLEPSLAQAGEIQFQRGDLVKGTYYEPHLTKSKDDKDYVFFHTSNGDESSLRKGIESTKYNTLATSKEEKANQYGVASYYTKPDDGERMVTGEQYAVHVPKDKVYPMDTDPNGYGDKAGKKIPEGTPFREAKIKKAIAESAKKDGYQMGVGEWGYDRGTGDSEGLPAMRADAFVPLKPEVEPQQKYQPATKEKIQHPDKEQIANNRKLGALMEDISDMQSAKGKYDDLYEIAEKGRIYGADKLTSDDISKLQKELPKRMLKRLDPLLEPQFQKGDGDPEVEGNHGELVNIAKEFLKENPDTKLEYFAEKVGHDPKDLKGVWEDANITPEEIKPIDRDFDNLTEDQQTKLLDEEEKNQQGKVAGNTGTSEDGNNGGAQGETPSHDRGSQPLRQDATSEDPGLQSEKPGQEQTGEGDSGQGSTFSTKNAHNLVDRAQTKLAPVDLHPFNATDASKKAKEAVDSGKVDPVDVVNELLSSKDIADKKVSQSDEDVLRYYQSQLAAQKTKLINVREDLAAKVKADPMDAKAQMDLASAIQRLQEHYDQQDRANQASIVGGNIWSKVGQSRQTVIDEQNNVQNTIDSIKNTYGESIPDDVRTQLRELQMKHDELQTKNEKITERLKKVESQKAYDKLKERERVKSASRPALEKQRDDIIARAKDKVAKILEKLKAKEGGPQFQRAHDDPETTEMVKSLAPDIQDLAKVYAAPEMGGLKDIDEVVDNIKHDLRDVDGLTKEHIRDVIAGEYAEKKTKSDLQKSVEDLRNQAKTQKRIEDLQAGVEAEQKKSGEASPKLQDLRDQLAEAKKEKAAAERPEPEKKLTPEEKKQLLNTSPEASAEDLHKQAEAIQRKIDKGEFDKPKFERVKFENDPEWIANNKDRANIMLKLKQLQADAMNSRKSTFMRVADWANKLTRRGIFFLNANSLGHLSSAAVLGSIIHRPIEEMAGRVFSAALPHLAASAPIEGYNPNVRAQATFYSNIFDAKKLAAESLDMAKTNYTDLKREFDAIHSGTADTWDNSTIGNTVLSLIKAEHIPYLELLFAGSHPIIKGPILRATFEASLVKHLQYYADRNIDFTHPLILESARQAAWNRAMYEIFQDVPTEKEKKVGTWQNYMSPRMAINKLRSEAIETRNKGGAWNKVVGNSEYAATALYNTLQPVVAVPSNMGRRGLLGPKMPYTVIDAICKNYGLKSGDIKLTHEESDVIMRQLKKGAVVSAYWIFGAIAYKSVITGGGLFTGLLPKNKRDPRKGELAPKELKIGDTEIPEWVQHGVYPTAFQMGLQWSLIYNHYSEGKGQSVMDGIEAAIASEAGTAAEQFPQVKLGEQLLNAGQSAHGIQQLKHSVKRDLSIDGIFPDKKKGNPQHFIPREKN